MGSEVVATHYSCNGSHAERNSELEKRDPYNPCLDSCTQGRSGTPDATVLTSTVLVGGCEVTCGGQVRYFHFSVFVDNWDGDYS